MPRKPITVARLMGLLCRETGAPASGNRASPRDLCAPICMTYQRPPSLLLLSLLTSPSETSSLVVAVRRSQANREHPLSDGIPIRERLGTDGVG